MKYFLIGCLWLSFICTVDASDEIEQTLNEFHLAAANADFEKYFSLLAEQSVFLGTDATERWDKKAFKSFVKPYFSKGNGWTYHATQRNITIAKPNEIVFFDELLHNKSYGQCRGSGMMIKIKNEWKILQYNLSIPVPNALSKKVVTIIKNHP